MNPADGDWRRTGKIALAIGFLIIFAGVLVTTVPQIAGADHSFVVLSDSMSPSMSAGSVVIVSEAPASKIGTGDVITYTRTENERITHRVVNVETRDGERLFRTKGDANKNPDPSLVSANNVIGEVQFHIPLVGYLIDFVGTSIGMVTFVVVPAVVLAISEAWALYQEANREESG